MEHAAEKRAEELQPPEHKMDDMEWKSFSEIQNVLALAEYCMQTEFAPSPEEFATYLHGHSKAAHRIRHDAMNMWTARGSDGTPSLAESFRAYWQTEPKETKDTKRAEIEKLDLTSQAVRVGLIAKIRGLHEQISEAS